MSTTEALNDAAERQRQRERQRTRDENEAQGASCRTSALALVDLAHGPKRASQRKPLACPVLTLESISDKVTVGYNGNKTRRQAANEALKRFDPIAAVAPLHWVIQHSALNKSEHLKRYAGIFREGFVSLLIWIAVFGKHHKSLQKGPNRLNHYKGETLFEVEIMPLVNLFASMYPGQVDQETILKKNIYNYVRIVKEKVSNYGVWSNARLEEFQKDSGIGDQAGDEQLCSGVQYELAKAATWVIPGFYRAIHQERIYLTNDENQALFASAEQSKFSN